MNTFTWLFLGHLVGDWLLQNDWMAKNKQNSLVTWAGFVHFAVYTTSVMLAYVIFVEPALSFQDMLLFAATIFVSHWLIDAADAARLWARLIQQTDIDIVRIVVDQTLHLLVIAGLIHFLLPA